MIEDPLSENQQALQSGVGLIFEEIGLKTEKNKVFDTSRDRIELDLFAIDPKSVDQIKYIVDCKNWNQPIGASIIQEFASVMHAVNANIGFIISNLGLQPEAVVAAKNTNVIGLTYEDFQRRYFGIWYEEHFVPRIAESAASLSQYVEPINSFRDDKINDFSPDQKKDFSELVSRYTIFGATLAFFGLPRYSNRFALPALDSIVGIKKVIQDSLKGAVELKAIYFRDLLSEIIQLIETATSEFNALFGRNIFPPDK